MSGGGGGSGNDGSNDMQVSGMEAAMSKEKGISTYAETRHSPSQSQRDKDGYSSMDNEEQAAYDNFYSTPDTSTVGSVSNDSFRDAQPPPGVSQAFDYETQAYQGDVNIDAGYGPGKITSAVYDAKTALVIFPGP